jgi:hypothetical protein
MRSYPFSYLGAAVISLLGEFFIKKSQAIFCPFTHLQTIQQTDAFDADMEINFSRFTVEVWTLTIGLLMVIERKVHRK